jgi:uncharacterized membrane protein YhaH (DUF805 family)
MNLSWFLDPIQKQYADFEGRSSRKQYWMFTLYYFIIAIVLGIVTGIVHLEFLGTILSLALLLPSLGLSFRRLHDINKSAWWLLISFVPLLGWLILIYFAVQPGDKGDNQYGKDPLTGGATAPVTPVATPTPQAEQQPPTTPTV